MTEQHPITPPPELVDKWVAMLEYCEDIDVFTDVARWGSDQELDASCEWMLANARFLDPGWIERLRAARRPKPPSLKEQALAALSRLNSGALCANPIVDKDTIRRALEQLDD